MSSPLGALQFFVFSKYTLPLSIPLSVLSTLQRAYSSGTSQQEAQCSCLFFFLSSHHLLLIVFHVPAVVYDVPLWHDNRPTSSSSLGLTLSLDDRTATAQRETDDSSYTLCARSVHVPTHKPCWLINAFTNPLPTYLATPNQFTTYKKRQQPLKLDPVPTTCSQLMLFWSVLVTASPTILSRDWPLSIANLITLVAWLFMGLLLFNRLQQFLFLLGGVALVTKLIKC